MSYTCRECDAPTSRPRVLCRSCGAKRRWETREPLRPFIEFQGKRYFKNGEGYYVGSRHKGGGLLHRAVWTEENGKIEDGWHVHHINGSKDDNRIENLIALSPSHHSAEHAVRPSCTEIRRARISASQRKRRAAQIPVDHTCEQCGKVFGSTGTRVRFCSPACNTKFWTWKRRHPR